MTGAGALVLVDGSGSLALVHLMVRSLVELVPRALPPRSRRSGPQRLELVHLVVRAAVELAHSRSAMSAVLWLREARTSGSGGEGW